MRQSSIILLIFVNVFLISSSNLLSFQVVDPDSVIRFQSPRPLISNSTTEDLLKSHWGLEMTVSTHGFGVAGYWGTKITDNLKFITRMDIFNAKGEGSNEIQVFDFSYQRLSISGKVNRLYSINSMIELRYDLFKDAIAPSLTPYIAGGVGPGLIFQLPYRDIPEEDLELIQTVNEVNTYPVVNFFPSLGDITTHLRFGGFVELGTGISMSDVNVVNLHIRYYYVPYGGEGIDSIINFPVENFGGLFLGASISFNY